MPLPQPEDFADRIRALEQAVRDLKSSITNAGGQTTASAGWKIPNQSFPSSPGDGGHLTSSGDEPIWTESGGGVYSLKPNMSPGSAVTDPPDFTSASSAGPTYDGAVQSMLTNLRADAAGTKIALDNLLSSLRLAGIIGF